MVAFMIKTIEEIYEDALLFSGKVLLLHNRSRPRLETEEEFYENLKKEKYLYERIKKENVECRAFMDRDLIIHLNRDILEGELFNEWAVSAIAHLQSHAFILGTNYGKRLLESDKEDIWIGEECSYAHGIGRYIEIETWNLLNTKGYRFEKIKEEVMEGFRSSQYYKAYEICQRLWNDAKESYHKGELNKFLLDNKRPQPNEIIRAGILFASRYVSEDFDTRFKRLETIPIPEIFSQCGLYIMMEPPPEIRNLEEYNKTILAYVGSHEQIWKVEREWIKLLNSLLKLGQKDLYERASKLHEMMGKYPGYTLIDRTPDLEGMLKEMMIEFLKRDVENLIESYKRM